MAYLDLASYESGQVVQGLQTRVPHLVARGAYEPSISGRTSWPIGTKTRFDSKEFRINRKPSRRRELRVQSQALYAGPNQTSSD